MVEEIESLVLEASVVDDFTRNLNDLSEKLAEIQTQEEVTFPTEADAHIASAMAELEALEQKMKSIDRQDIDVDVDTEVGLLQARAMATAPPDYDILDKQIEDDFFNAARGPRERDHGTGLMQRMMRNRTPVLSLPETDIIPDLDTWRRRDHDRGLVQNVRDAIDEFSDLKLTMGFLMNILAALVPLLVVFVGALPAAIAGVAALAAGALVAAGALAAIGGLALGGMMFQGGELNVSEAQRHLRELLDVFIEAFTPLMDALRPVAETLFRNAEFAIREIAVAMHGLLSMTDEMGDGIRFVAETIGSVTSEAIAFSEAMMPVLAFIGGGLASIDWFGLFASIIADILPLLTKFAAHMMRIAPVLYEMSIGFFEVALAITSIVAGVFTLIDMFGPLAQIIGGFIAITLTAVSVTSLWSIAFGAVAERVSVLIKTLFVLAARAIQQAVASITSYTIAMWQAYIATAALVGLLSFGLAPLMSSVIGGLTGMDADMGNTLDRMDSFQRSGTSGTQGSGVDSATSGPSYRPTNNMTVVVPDKETGNAVSNTLRYNNDDGSTTDQSDVDNRHHSG